jgi:glycosyltransferase involved in cell wall biosynthesis
MKQPTPTLNQLRRLRIAVIIPGFPASNNGWFLPQISKLQVELKEYVDITVFALSHPRSNESYEWQGLPVQSFGAWRKGSWLPVSLVSLVKQHSKTKFDLIHAYWATEPGLVGALAKRILGIPLLITGLGSEFVSLPEINYGAQLKWRWRRLLPFVLHNADGIIYGCKAQMEMAENVNGFASGQKILQPVGVEIKSNHIKDKKSHNIRLLAVSSMIAVKNISLILQTMVKLPATVTLKIIGDGPIRKDLEELSNSLGLSERVVFMGWVHHEEMNKYYNSSDIFVHASVHEAECFAIQEALAAGLPIVSSNVGIARDVVIPDTNGFLFDPKNPGEFAAAINKFVAHPELCQSFGAARMVIAQEKLNRLKQVSKLINLYTKMTGKKA